MKNDPRLDEIKAFCTGITSISSDCEVDRLTIQFDDRTTLDDAYSVACQWCHMTKPQSEAGAAGKQRRRERFLELYEEFGNEAHATQK